MVDDQNLNGALLRLQLQTKLFCKRSKNRRTAESAAEVVRSEALNPGDAPVSGVHLTVRL